MTYVASTMRHRSRPAEPDTTAILMACDGEKVQLYTNELALAIMILAERGLGVTETARRLGCCSQTVRKYRRPAQESERHPLPRQRTWGPVDEQRVARACAGERLQLFTSEMQLCVERLLAEGLSLPQIARRLQCDRRTVRRYRDLIQQD